MKINDAHCHFGFNGFFGTIGRDFSFISKSDYGSLKKEWDKYNIQKVVLFSQPEPANLKRYFGELAATFSGYLLFKKYILSQPIDESVLADNDYSGINDTISKLIDNRIEFVPFVDSKVEIHYLERFENIKGVKFYEPHGKIPDTLLSYLNENELNMILQLSKESEIHPEKFLNLVDNSEGVKFQVAHCANGVKQIIDALDEYSNLFIDTSAISHNQYRHIQIGKIAQEHSDRLLFGSDKPWTQYSDQLKTLENLNLEKKNFEDITNRNYFKIWGGH